MKVCIFVIFYIFSSIVYVSAKENKIDNITAIVNDQIILNSDVNQILFLLQKEGKDFRIPWKNNFLKEKIIQKLIIKSLILQEANRMNITVTKEQVNTVIKNICLKKNISVEDLKKNILLHNLNNHFTYDNYIKNIENSLKIKMMQDYEMHKRINISEEEVNVIFKELIRNNKKFQKINLSYVLIPSSQKYSDKKFNNQKILAEKIVTKLKKGYDFEHVYKKFKNKKDFLVKKMFWMHFPDVQKVFSNKLNISEKGQILGPILGNKGFYILKVNDIHNKENIVTDFYIQHCLVKPSAVLTNSESKKHIFNIYEKIKKGVYTFDYAVRNLSHDFYSSKKNGDLGWISKELFDVDLNKKLLYLNKNEISRPIHSRFGWHIIKLINKREVDQFYKFKRKEAYNILLEKKMILEKNNWIKDLKNISYINIIR
ncbi:peptidylprolyl isomerase [Buchnera aphidicola (Hyperomyzus lactucae)]|uniref:Peptidylprolyl isomerase n=2 Tax=Buchnera aphidicola TaxID=9 RepID=A0A4D6Y2Z1_9GAMM|nr:peptidylprolyl isomerase [Buchnera aphidicola (Hyperomyzus lactucae)]